ncbi:MAG: LPS export ABC transporter permease LptG [Gammaproteobacteria bacterium]|nr:LPS export ABC transporter permease LptG [Gammaproteobacteria bacterium]
MIVNRYIQRNIHLGTLGALLLLVSLSLFFTFVSELDDMGKGNYGILQVLEYLALSTPGQIVEFLPLAVLLGSMLSLGALANNSELIAMQASGITIQRLLGSVLQAALVVALLGFLLADWIVPDSEINARRLKSLSLQQSSSVLDSKQGLWIKDESRVVHVQNLLPNGYAREIEIYQLDADGNPRSMIWAEGAEPAGGGWELHQVRQTTITDGKASSRIFDRLIYPGNVSHQLLQVLMVDPRQMSSSDLIAYLQFLDENRLDAEVERLIFWQKMFAPVTIVIMCLLAFPFVMGSQRQSNTGQRLLIGILLGLSFAVIDRVLTQLGSQFGVNAFMVALAPNLMFFTLALYLIIGKQSLGVGSNLFFTRRKG